MPLLTPPGKHPIRPMFDGADGTPAITVTPASKNFGNIPVGQAVPQVFLIESTGTAPLVLFLPITIVGAEASAFTVTTQPTETSPGRVTLAPGASTTFTLQADADVVDVFSADISIVSNVPGSPTLIPIEVDVSALLYSDEFSGTVAAPIPAGNADVRGYRVLNDVENLMTIGTGVLTVPAQLTAVFGEEFYRAQPNVGQQYWTRPAGKALVAVVSFRHTTRNGQIPVGWWTSATLNDTARGARTNSVNILAVDNAVVVSDGQGYSVSTDYLGIAVWDSTGFSIYANIAGVWHLKWRKYETVTQAFCGMSNLTSAGSLKYFRIYAIDESLFAPALSITAPSVGNLANMPDGDFLLYLDNITRPSAGNIELYGRKKNAGNYWRQQIQFAGGFAIYETISSSPTLRINSAGVVSTDDIITIARGATIQAWRNMTPLSSPYIVAFNWLREVGLEINSYGTGGAIGALRAYRARLLTETGLGPELVTNGNFETGGGWSLEAGWSIASSKATKVAGSSAFIYQNANMVVGEYYRLVFTISDYTAGALQPYFGSGGQLAGISGNGTYSIDGVCVGNGLLYFQANSLFAGSIDTISCRKITLTPDSLALVLDGLAA